MKEHFSCKWKPSIYGRERLPARRRLVLGSVVSGRLIFPPVCVCVCVWIYWTNLQSFAHTRIDISSDRYIFFFLPGISHHLAAAAAAGRICCWFFVVYTAQTNHWTELKVCLHECNSGGWYQNEPAGTRGLAALFNCTTVSQWREKVHGNGYVHF